MHAIGTIRVVLGEGQPGLLRLVLEAQGFEVIGHARDDEELLRVLDVTTPSVVVLDAGISAIAASAVELRAGSAQVVLVWPKDVVTTIVAERVDPAAAILELGNAVRRAAQRQLPEEPIRIPEAASPSPSPSPSPAPAADIPVAAPTTEPVPRARHHVLVAVAAWVLALTALGAIGVAVPRVFGPADHDGIRQPAGRGPEPSRVVDREGPRSGAPPSPDEGGNDPACAPGRDVAPEPGLGKGCGQGKATGANGKANGKGNGQANGNERADDPDKGRPDDPGERGNPGAPGGGKGGGASDDPGADPPAPNGSGADARAEDGRGHGSSDDGPAQPPGGKGQGHGAGGH